MFHVWQLTDPSKTPVRQKEGLLVCWPTPLDKLTPRVVGCLMFRVY